jgi:hypothetical protein
VRRAGRGLQEVARLLDVPPAEAGREVDDRVDTLGGCLDAAPGRQVCGDQARSRTTAEDADLVAGRAEVVDGGPAEGAGAAGDEDGSQLVSFRSPAEIR